MFQALFIKSLKKAAAYGFYLVSRMGAKVEVEINKDFSFSPPVLVIANHQSDLDVPLVASLFFFHPSLKAQRDKICFVAEEDLFLPGYFPQHFSLPPFLARLLFNFSMGKILRSVGAFPVFKMTDLSLGRILRILKEKEGLDLKLGEVLSEEGANLLSRLFHRETKEIFSLTLKEALNWKHYRQLKRSSGSEILNEKYARFLREERVHAAYKQMEFFSSLLKDRVLLLFPEGEITQTGKLGKIRGGTYRILEKAEWKPAVLPITLNYDFLGRRRALVVFGKAQEAHCLKAERGEFTLTIENLLKEGMRVMFSHVGSAALYLLKKRKTAFFNKRDFEKVLRQVLAIFKRFGAKIDPALDNMRYLRSRSKNFLRFLRKKGYIVKLRGCFLLFQSFLEDKPDRVRHPVGYYYEKLQDFPFYSELKTYLEEEKEPALTLS